VSVDRPNEFLPIRLRDIWLAPNLVSLSRMLITPVVGYYLTKDNADSTIVCVVLLVAAALTDGLDGYLARRLNMRTGLGLVLDPLADKLFAAVLLVELVLFRGFPVWLAGCIIGRDILILAGGMLVLRRKNISSPSNVIGRYTFFAVILLLGFYVIRFAFGIQLVTVITVFLLLLSLGSYGLRFVRIARNRPMEQPTDRPIYRVLRVTVAAVLLAICAVMLVLEKWL
jgi:cardiolipin synthase